jgi:hypothetical protein
VEAKKNNADNLSSSALIVVSLATACGLNDSAVRTERSLMIGLIQEPESPPLHAHIPQVFGGVNQLTGSHRWVGIIDRDDTADVATQSDDQQRRNEKPTHLIAP